MRDESLDAHRDGRYQVGTVLLSLRRANSRTFCVSGWRSMKKSWPILVVDDEDVMCESMAAWLREDGYRVDTASNGQQAVELAKGADYAICFVDSKNARRNGWYRDHDGNPSCAPGRVRHHYYGLCHC